MRAAMHRDLLIVGRGIFGACVLVSLGLQYLGMLTRKFPVEVNRVGLML